MSAYIKNRPVKHPQMLSSRSNLKIPNKKITKREINMGKWHPKTRGAYDSSELLKEFKDAGRLYSLVNELSQNASDNPANQSEAVLVRITFKSVPTSSIKPYMNEAWERHVGSNWCKGKSDLVNRQPADPLLPEPNCNVLLFEDYQTTGLVGDESVWKPKTDPNGCELHESFNSNTFFWFFRATGMSIATEGRGGSRGLGKKACPLGSDVATFFCVSSRNGSVGSPRVLAGQTNLVTHGLAGGSDDDLYDGVVSYGADELTEPSNSDSWIPVTESSEIDEFCEVFGVDRPAHKIGTSIVIPCPVQGIERESNITIEHIKACLLANWTIPVSLGRIKFELVDEVTGSSCQINKDTVDQELAPDVWASENLRIGSKYAISNDLREKKFIRLCSVLEELRTGVRDADLKLSMAYGSAPSLEDVSGDISDKSEALSQRLTMEKSLFVEVDVPVTKTDGTELAGKAYVAISQDLGEPSDLNGLRIQRGNLHLVNESSKPAYSYPGHTSLVWVPKKLGSDETNHLHELLRKCEGPAHIKFDAKTSGSAEWRYREPTLKVVRRLSRHLLTQILEASQEAQTLWSLPVGQQVSDRNFSIEQVGKDGFKVIKRADATENLQGRRFLVRIAHPKVRWGEFVGAAEVRQGLLDRRDFDIGAMSFERTAAEVSYVEIDGQSVPDRFEFQTTSEQFSLKVVGLDPMKMAEVIITPFDGDDEEGAVDVVSEASDDNS